MKFITGKHLPRRSFLRGVGSTVAFPMLDAMIPAGRSWRDAAADPGSTRLICMEEVLGTAGSSPLGAEQGLFLYMGGGDHLEFAADQLRQMVREFPQAAQADPVESLRYE